MITDYVAKIQKLTIIPEDINILLVGERSSGKSTFAHAFANYIKYDQFSVAQEKVSYLSSCFLNEMNTSPSHEGNSADVSKNPCGQQEDNQNVHIIPTKDTCSFIIPLPKYGRRIHLIDTPGFCDVSNEMNNFESILSYISQIEDLHAVCFVLKPTSSTERLVLQYRIKFWLLRLQKAAINNLIFLFTHTKSSYYSSSCTYSVLREILYQSGFVSYLESSVFHLDNEVFHFLMSAKDAVGHDNKMEENYSKLWGQSVAECWRMIERILGKDVSCENISSFRIDNTILLHNARKIISQASQFFADIANIIEHLAYAFVLTDDILLNRNIQPTGSVQHVLSSCSLRTVQELMVKFEQEKTVYNNDKKQKTQSALQNLAWFVKGTAILIYNDSHEAYIKYLINREVRQVAEKDTDTQTVINYHGLLKQYIEENHIIYQKIYTSSTLNTAELLKGMEELKKLEKIKQNFETLHRDVIAARTK